MAVTIERERGESLRILDVGAGDNPDPRATETVDIQPGADHVFDLSEEWPLADQSVNGIIARHVVEHLENPAHFFDEAGRVLIDGGNLEVSVPVGENAKTDLDHAHEWRHSTPEQFCRRQQRAWDPETDFVLVDRDADVWLGGPLRPLSPLMQALSVPFPNWAVHRCYSGELTAAYRRVHR